MLPETYRCLGFLKYRILKMSEKNMETRLLVYYGGIGEDLYLWELHVEADLLIMDPLEAREEGPVDEEICERPCR